MFGAITKIIFSYTGLQVHHRWKYCRKF